MSAIRISGRGFTSVELVITLLITGIFAALAFPSFVSTVRNTRLTTTVDMIVSDLTTARREAIKRNTRVYMCPVGTGGLCDTVSTTWANGWQVCYDLVNNSTAAMGWDNACDINTTTDPNPVIVRGKIDSSMTLTYPAIRVIYNANGTRGTAGGGTTSFVLTGTWTGSATYTISLPTSGNITVTQS